MTEAPRPRTDRGASCAFRGTQPVTGKAHAAEKYLRPKPPKPVTIVEFRVVRGGVPDPRPQIASKVDPIMDFSWRRRPLTLLLWASFVIPLVTVASIIGWSYDTTMDEARRAAVDRATILREHALRVFETQLSAIAFIDTRLGDMSWDQVAQSEEVHRMLKSISLTSPHMKGIGLVAPDGAAANSADVFPVPPLDTTAREYFRVLSQNDVVHLGETIRGYLNGELNFNISRRRTSPDGSFNGLILVTSDIAYFDAFWQELSADTGQIVFIVRADGKILAQHPNTEDAPPEIPSDSSLFQLITDPGANSFTATRSPDGVTRMFGAQRLGSFPAYIAVGIDRSAILAPWIRESVALAVIAAVISGLLALVVRMAQRAERRHLEEVERRRGAEATLIAKEEHLSALQAAESELRQSENRFRALFETSTQGVVHLSASGHVLDANPAAQTMLGYEIDDIRGWHVRDLDLEAMDEEGANLAPAERPAGIALRSGEIVRGFIIGLRAHESGEHRWFKMDAIPQRRPYEQDPWSVFLLMDDITEQRRSAETERMLAAEVDHRSKNMLAVVQAILRLSRGGRPEDFAESVEGRITALARAHTLLSDAKWRDVALRPIIQEAVAPFRWKHDRDSVDLRGPSIQLKPRAAQPLSLMVHELATNAAKYGALSVPEGHLTVRWEIDQQAGMLRILWDETGGPVVTRPERMSFGSRLIRLSVEEELGGSIAKDWRPEGMLATIEIPLRHIAGSVADRPATEATPADAGRPAPSIRGARILFCEDNPVVAMEMQDLLESLGVVVVGPADSLDEAARLAALEQVDAALLDIDLHGKRIFPVAELLREKGIPLAFCTGFTVIDELDSRWRSAIVVNKPVSNAQIEQVLRTLLARTPATAAP